MNPLEYINNLIELYDMAIPLGLTKIVRQDNALITLFGGAIEKELNDNGDIVREVNRFKHYTKTLAYKFREFTYLSSMLAKKNLELLYKFISNSNGYLTTMSMSGNHITFYSYDVNMNLHNKCKIKVFSLNVGKKLKCKLV